MDNIWKVEVKADDCPVQMWDVQLTGQRLHRVHKLSVGDEIYIDHTYGTYKLGDKYGDSPLVCNEIIYKPRKWWQKLMFWKKKEIVGYIFKVIE